MQKHVLILFLFFFQQVHAQIISYEYCFDQVGNCTNYMMSDPEPVLNIDFVSNPDNIWHMANWFTAKNGFA